MTGPNGAQPKIEVQNLNAWFRGNHALRGVSLTVPANTVLAIIGPSGCGKSTFVRCINRMHELVPGAHQSGHILVDGQDLHARGVDPVDLRRRVGMVFQRANPFPTMSIVDNVVAGRAGGEEPATGRALGRSEGSAPPVGALALGRPAAEALHRSGPGRRARGHAHG